MKVGVVLFQGDTLEDGVAAINGECFSVESLGDLSTDTIWILSTESESFNSANLDKTDRYRNGNFFRTRIKAIIKELGMIDFSLEEQATVISKIVNNVFFLAKKFFGIDYIPPVSLAAGIRDNLNLPKEDSQNANLNEAIKGASQSYVFCEVPKWRNYEKVFTLSLHRQTHAKRVLRQLIPKGRWSSIEDNTFLNDHEKILNHKKPLLLKIVIHKINKFASPLINHGAGAGRSVSGAGSKKVLKGNAREWVTIPEFKVLKKVAEVSVVAAMEGETFIKNPVQVPQLSKELNELSFCSYSFGLLCESIWSACTYNNKGERLYSPISSWIMSLDRVACFSTAYNISYKQEESVINSYGYGTVICRLIDTGDEFGFDIFDTIKAGKCLPPVIDPAIFKGTIEGESHLEILQSIYLKGDIQTLLELDSVFINSLT